MGVVIEVGIYAERIELLSLIGQQLITVVSVGNMVEYVAVLEKFALADFEIDPVVSADILGIVAVVPVAVDRIANLELRAVNQVNCGNAVTILTSRLHIIVFFFFLVYFQKGSKRVASDL